MCVHPKEVLLVNYFGFSFSFPVLKIMTWSQWCSIRGIEALSWTISVLLDQPPKKLKRKAKEETIIRRHLFKASQESYSSSSIYDMIHLLVLLILLQPKTSVRNRSQIWIWGQSRVKRGQKQAYVKMGIEFLLCCSCRVCYVGASERWYGDSSSSCSYLKPKWWT